MVSKSSANPPSQSKPKVRRTMTLEFGVSPPTPEKIRQHHLTLGLWSPKPIKS